MAFLSPNKTGESGLAEVRSMLQELEEDLEKTRLSSTKQSEYVSKLKIYGRSLETATPIFEGKSIDVLSRYAMQDTGTISHEALRCVANAFLLKEETRQMFVDQNHVPEIVRKLRNPDMDDQFLCARVLFLLTYNTNLDFAKLIEDHGLAQVIVEDISSYDLSGKASNSEPINVMAISELCQLTFNIIHHFPSTARQFDAAVDPIVRILLRIQLIAQPLQPPISAIINVLLNLDIGQTASSVARDTLPSEAADDRKASKGSSTKDSETIKSVDVERKVVKDPDSNETTAEDSRVTERSSEQKNQVSGTANAVHNISQKSDPPDTKSFGEETESLRPEWPVIKSKPKEVKPPNAADAIHKLVQILDKSTTAYSEEELEKLAMPLFTLLRRICEIVDDHLRSVMAGLLLPSDEEREKPLGQGDTLAARLLRLSVSPLLPQVRGNISNLLFELSDKDPDTFTKNVGFGYASGFLLSHGMVAPEGRASNGASITSSDAQINPVTGQRVDSQTNSSRSELPEMTEEEKEQEAERLFVLFERLRATGVVDVQNPVRRIYQGD